MGLHYLTFVERDLENRKQLPLVQIINSVCINSMNIVNSVGNFNDIASMNSVFNE